MVEEAKAAVGEEGDDDYVPAVDAKYVTTHFESADLDGTDYTPTTGDYAGKTYKLEAVKNDKGAHVTKVILTETFNIDGKDSFLNILYEITAVVEPLLAFLFKGEDINILIDTFGLKGSNGFEAALVPLAKALNITLKSEEADDYKDANEMLKAVVDGIFGLVEDIEKAPISTILELLGTASYFIANDGIAFVINNLIAPVTGLLSIFEKKTTVVEDGVTVEKSEGITMADINKLLKSLIKMDLNDITGIAGADGSKLVSMINGLLPKVELVGEDDVIRLAEPLPSKFFEIMSTYAINYDSMTNAQKKDSANYRTLAVTDWSVDKADVLMYLLSTVCSDDFIAFLGSVLKAEEGTVLGDLIYGLSGDEDLVINIISMLLNEYTLVYNKYAQVDITKINVDPKDPLTDENLAQAIQAIDGLVPAIIGLLVKDADSLKSLVENLVAGADLGNLLMNLLVPLLAGLNIDEILGYVKEFSNLDIKLDPSAWTADADSEVAKFILAADADNDGKVTWADVEKYYTQYEFTYEIPATADAEAKKVTVYKPAGTTEITVGEGEEAKPYDLTAVNNYEYTYTVVTGEGEEAKTEEKTIILDKNDYTTYDVDGNAETAEVVVTLSKTIQKAKMLSEYDWNIDTFADLKNFAVDLLKPLDVVFELLLAGSEIVIAPDTKTDVEPYPAQITVRGGDGYNFAIIPLLEAIGATGLKTQDEYETYSEAKGSHLAYVLDVLFAEVEAILAAPVSQLMSRLANLFYFIGNNSINDLADNLLAPVNTLIAEVDPIFPLAINIDIAAEEILGLYLGKAHAGIEAGIHVNVNAADLAELLNGLLEGIVINGTKLGLSLDLDWITIAAKMAKTEDAAEQSTTGAKVAKKASSMDYDAYENVEGTTGYADGKYYNIEGNVVDTFVTLLQVLLTVNNTEAVRNLVLGLLEDGELKDILDGILSDPDAIEKVIGVVVLLLTGEGAMADYPLAFAYKFLGELNFNYKTEEIKSAISKFDAMIAREAVGVIKMIGAPAENVAEKDYTFFNKMAVALEADDSLADLVAWLLGEFAFTSANFDTVMGLLNNILADAITADLAGIIATILPINLMPYEFAQATGNAKLQAYVAKAFDENATEDDKKAVTWADVRSANATLKDGKWTYAESWSISGKDAFVGTILDLLKPLNPILDFLFAGKKLSFNIEGVELWGANGYANAIVPLLNALGAKQLGVNLPETAADTSTALGYIVDALLGTADAKGVVDAICEAPLTSILKIVGNLSYFLANGNLDELIQNLVAPVMGILDLAESLLSREQLDKLIEGLAKITLPGGKALNITNIINIAGNEGEGLVALINELIGGIRAYEKTIVEEDGKKVSKIVVYTEEQVKADPEGEYWPVEIENEDGTKTTVYYKVLQMINLLPDDFFKQFAKYVVEDSEYDDIAVVTVGDDVDEWTINTADALMYVLSTVLDYDFFETILKKVGLDLSQGIGQTVLTMADKENELVDVLVMLLNDYNVVYTKVQQATLPADATTPYANFGKDAEGNNLLDNENVSNAIAALDPLINTIIAMVADGKTLGGLVNGLIADADLANLIMNALVPVLSGLNIDNILAYVNELTNINLTTLNPTLWSENDKVKFGSELKNFIGDAKTWAEVKDKYTQYEYTYTIPAKAAVGTEGEEGYVAAVPEQTITVWLDAGETEIEVTEGEAKTTYALTKVLGEDGKTQNSKMLSKFDWKIEDLNDLVPLVCDLLQPLDIVLQILLSGKPIVALGDESEARADIRIMGGYGYNYAIIPLLEAFGATGLKTQAQYDAQVAADGSSLKYILETLIGEVNEILATPLNELLSRLANLFYFIGSDGVNAIADNLLAPLNTLIEEVDDLFPLAIRIDVAADEILGLYLGKEHEGIPAGITVNVAGADLAKLINGLIENLKIGDIELNLHLDLDWTAIAAKMAEKDSDGKVLTTASKQVYSLGTVKNPTTPDLVNITGDAANALVTLLDTVLTEDNCENIYNLVTGLLKNLDPTLKGIIEDLIGSPESIKGIVAAVVLILTGEYDVTNLDYIFKYLGTIAFSKNKDAKTAVESLDRVLVKAVPVVIELLAKDVTDKNNFLYKIYNGTNKYASLDNIVNWLLNDLLFTDDMMNTITGALLGLLKGIGTDITDILKDFLGIDLAPAAFAAASGNAQLIAYVGDAATWAEVVENNTEDGVLAPVFTGVNSKDAFVGAILDMLKPLEKVLAFLLTGEDLVVTVETNGEKAQLTLKGGNAYESAIVPLLYQGLGLEELVKGTNKADYQALSAKKVTTANAAIGAVVDTLLVDLVGAVKAAPLTTILTAVANLAYFIANDDVAVVIQNLVAPVLGIVDALGGVISRAQLDALIGGLVNVTLPNGKKLNITNIINIAGDNGAILVDLINGLLPNIAIKDENGNVIQTVNALPDTFFLDLAKAAVKPVKDSEKVVDADVTEWTTDIGGAIMYVLSTVLTKDFLTILCDALNIEPTTKNEDGTESENMVYGIITSLAGSSDAVVDLLLMLLNRYLVEYKPYTQPSLDKTAIDYGSDASSHDSFNQIISSIDGLIPVVLDLLVKPDANGNKISSLADLVYPLFVKDDIANLLVSAIAKLLAGLPADTITMVEGLVSDLANLKNTKDADGKDAFSIAPQAFTADNFGSKLDEYIGDAATWAAVWAAHSEAKKDENGNIVYKTDADGNIVKDADGAPVPELVASAYEWGIKDVDDFINLLCDFLSPLDCVLTLLTQGGMVRADFDEADPNGSFRGKTLAVFEEIAISGGSGYNYALVPLLELLGAKPMTQVEYDKAVAANHGSALYPVLTMLFDRVDELLNAPIKNVLGMLANLCYALGTGSVATIVENLIAPVNNVIAAVDEIFPIAIPIDVGALINGGTLELYLGKEHPGIDAGISFKLDGNDISTLLEDLLAGLAINGVALGLDVNLDWLALAAAGGADANGDGKVDLTNSVMETKWDIYEGAAYKNIKGDAADTFITLLNTILTEENWNALKEALGLNLGDFEGIVDGIIKDPTSLVSLIASILSSDVKYIPVQNRAIVAGNFDYSKYLALTEYNADTIAANLDGIINKVLKEAGLGNSLKDFIVNKFITSETLNSLADLIFGLLGSPSVEGILGTVAGLTSFGENGETPLLMVGEKNGDKYTFETLELNLTVEGYAAKYAQYKNANATVKAALAGAETWADVKFAGRTWAGVDGNVAKFIDAIASLLNPLNNVLELLLMGDGKELCVLPNIAEGTCVVSIKGGNGYDYAIIPLLEAFGLGSDNVYTQAQYEAAVTADSSRLLGYVLGQVGFFAEKLLSKPVDKLLEILPNLAYFISNEGIFLVVRNLIAPIYSVLSLLGVDLASILDLNKLLGGINIPIQLLGAKYNFSIPEIDWYELARQGADSVVEVTTSRSQKANAFVDAQKLLSADPDNKATPDKSRVKDLYTYLSYYPTEYTGFQQKNGTHTYIKSDKGDTLTYVLTWALNMFSSAKNREALVQFLVQLFDLESGAETTVRYALNKLFDTANEAGAAELLVAALFEVFNIGIVIDTTISGSVKDIQKIYEELFKALGSNSDCAYSGIAKVMEDLTGVWNDTVGDHEDYEDATEEVEESLNWFQRLIAKIKAFFAKIFSIFK